MEQLKPTRAQIFDTHDSDHLSPSARRWVLYWFRLDHPAHLPVRGDAMARYHAAINTAFVRAWALNARTEKHPYELVLAEVVEYVSNQLTYFVPAAEHDDSAPLRYLESPSRNDR